MPDTPQLLCDLQEIDLECDKIQRQIEYVSETMEDDEARQTLEKKLKSLKRRRKKQANQIDEDDLARYDKLRGSYAVDAVAPIEVSGKKKPYTYYCGGCLLALPAEEANILQQGDKSIRTCNHCGRMLYFQQEQEAKA